MDRTKLTNIARGLPVSANRRMSKSKITLEKRPTRNSPVLIASAILAFSSFSLPAMAQTWVKTYRLPIDIFDSIIQTSDGGFLVSGRPIYPDPDSGLPEGRALIGKLDSAGNVEWAKTSRYGVQGLTQAIETVDGGFALGSNVSILGYDWCYDVRAGLSKYDSTGELLWYKEYGPDQARVAICEGGQTSLSGLAQAQDGSFFLSGTVSDGSSPSALWMVKVDSDGNLLWQKKYGGPQVTYSPSSLLGLLPNGGIVIVGYGKSYTAGKDDVWVLWLDMNGDIVRQRAFGGTEDETPNSLAVTAAGEVIIASHSWSFDPGGTHYGGQLWVLKLGTTGDIVWQKSISPMGYPAFNPRLTELPNGNLAVLSVVSIWSNIPSLVELSPEGNVLWSKAPDIYNIWSDEIFWGDAIASVAGGGFVFSSRETYTEFPLLFRTDAFGGIGDICPMSDYAGFGADAAATITPSAAVAVSTDYPIFEPSDDFFIDWPTTEVVELCSAQSPQIDISPPPDPISLSIEFGNVEVGGTSSKTITVSNSGNADLVIFDMYAQDQFEDNLYFTLISSCAGQIISPGASCDSVVQTTPPPLHGLYLGRYTGYMVIRSNDPSINEREISLGFTAYRVAALFSDDFESGDTSFWSASVP